MKIDIERLRGMLGGIETDRLIGLRDQLERIYAVRACLICGKTGWCQHREPQVDRAELRVGADREDAL